LQPVLAKRQLRLSLLYLMGSLPWESHRDPKVRYRAFVTEKTGRRPPRLHAVNRAAFPWRSSNSRTWELEEGRGSPQAPCHLHGPQPGIGLGTQTAETPVLWGTHRKHGPGSLWTFKNCVVLLTKER